MSRFLLVKCLGCEKELTVFSNTATIIVCKNCGYVVAKPTGGNTHINADIIDILDK